MARGKAHDLLDRVRRGEIPRPIIIGHRGFAGRFPENSLSAFRAGIEAGAEVIELDYQHSADGVPIVIHDATLERTTNAEALWGEERLAVSERTAEELGLLDCGAKFGPFFRNEPLPKLAAALDLIQASRVTMIERKSGDAATLLQLLRWQNCELDVVVQAFDWDFLRDLRKLSINVILGALGKEELTPSLVREAADIGVEIVTWRQEILDARGIKIIHQAGKQAWTYTVNDAARAEELFTAGIDGLISNFPNEMMKLRASEIR